MRLNTNKKLLIYVQGERSVGKSRFIKVLEIEFTLLNKHKEL